MRIAVGILLGSAVALSIAGCSREKPLTDNPKLTSYFSAHYKEYLDGVRLDAVSTKRPGEIAVSRAAPLLSRVSFVCNASGVGRASIDYSVTTRDGRSSSGSRFRTCSGGVHRVELTIASPTQVAVRTSGEERNAMYTDDLAKSIMNDMRSAIESAASDLEIKNAVPASPSKEQVEDSWK